MRNQGVGSWPVRRARTMPDRTAIVHEGRAWTYDELSLRTTRLAHALRELGVRRGDRVAYLGQNHPAFLETLLATATLGGVFVPLNIRLSGPELTYNLADSGADVLVYGPEQELAVEAIESRLMVRDLVAVGGSSGVEAYDKLVACGATDPIDEPVRLDDPCMIMYTSGTTGRPKGAVITHGNVTWNCVNVLVDIDLTADEVTLATAPLFHTAGLNMTCLPTLLKGGQVVVVPSVQPDRVLDLIEEHRVTVLFGVPTTFAAMARSPRWDTADLSSLRVLLCGGAPVPEELIRGYQRRGLRFLQGYGMTETAPGALLLGATAADHVGSAGKPHFFTDVRVVGPDMSATAPGEPGEIVVQGPNVTPGYWENPDATDAARTADGWFRSGDVGITDEQGFCFVVDRVTDMYITGGENVYPAEIEKLLFQHPAVADCAVIGVPDERWGEVGKALVVPAAGTDPTPQDILDSLSGVVAKYKIPASVEFVTTLPRTPSGKIEKRRLRPVVRVSASEPC